jgi:ABC-type nitrate/sulfonate/bicarbonate transport system permease component
MSVVNTVKVPKTRRGKRSLWVRMGESTLYAFGLPLILIGLWAVWATATSPKFFPTPAELAEAFVDTWVGKSFFEDVVPSLTRLGVGIIASIAVGIAVGTLVGLSRVLRELVEPIFEFFRAIPPPVMIPVITVILGATDSTKVIIIVLGAVWPVLLNTIDGVRGTDSVMKETARSFRITPIQRLWSLVLPAAMPRIMTGIRQAMSIALILMVISEMSNTSAGLGNRIVYFQRNYLVAEMWSGIALLGLVGVLLALIFGIVERRMLRWYHGVKETERG